MKATKSFGAVPRNTASSNATIAIAVEATRAFVIDSDFVEIEQVFRWGLAPTLLPDTPPCFARDRLGVAFDCRPSRARYHKW